MLYCYRAYDGPDSAAKRNAHLAGHLRYVETHWRAYALAGPLLNQEGAMIGSLFLVRAAMQAEADALMAQDPYMTCGLYARVETSQFRPAAGDMIGGITW